MPNKYEKNLVPAPDSKFTLRITELIKLMAKRDLSAWVLLYGNAHHGEFIAPYRRRVAALCGFSGSAGVVVIGIKEAHLWVDSRYYVQAEQEISSLFPFFKLHKQGLQGVKPWPVWLAEDFAPKHAGTKIGYDAFQFPISVVSTLRSSLSDSGCTLESQPDNLVDLVWQEAQATKKQPLRAVPVAWSGQPARDKLNLLHQAMQRVGAEALLLSKLDQVAWMLNLRGGDIPMNPVFESWLLLAEKNSVCFTDAPVPADLVAYTKGWLDFKPYQALKDALAPLNASRAKVWLDKKNTSEGIRIMLKEAECFYQPQLPVDGWKAIKNPAEIACAQAANISAGLAKVRLLTRIATSQPQAFELSEADISDMMALEYAREAGFESLSFETISGYGPNAAIIHYSQPSKEVKLAAGGMLLLDSGIQLGGATTDDTRTIIMGKASTEQCYYYTAVLRAHIRLAGQVFPAGTVGSALDSLARAPLWQIGKDYSHGTGHGVGAMLHVHEGPQSISPTARVPLVAGMIISNEPGYYREGWGGIRLENLYLIEPALEVPPHPAGHGWLRLKPLSMIPFDKRLIHWSSLFPDEQQWLRDYHQLVYQQLAKKLDSDTSQWLEQACRLPN